MKSIFKMKSLSWIILFILSFTSNTQEICKSDYICRYSSNCGDGMSCFCADGKCRYGPPPYKLKIQTISLRGTNKTV